MSDTPVFIRLQPDFSTFNLPWQKDYSLVIIQSGRGLHLEHMTEYPISAGNVFIVRKPDQAVLKNQGGLSLSILSFSKAYLDQVQEEFTKTLPGFTFLFESEPNYRKLSRFRERLVLSASQLASQAMPLAGLEKELGIRDSGFEAAVYSYFIEILVQLSRFVSSRSSPASSGVPAKMEQVMRHIQEHFKEKIKITQLARMAGLSYSHFMSVFRKSFGASPVGYILRLRIDEACRLLQDPNQTITKIAEKTGFVDSNYFARQFRQMMKISPTDYRKQYVPAIKPKVIGIIIRIYWEILLGEYYPRLLTGIFEPELEVSYERQLIQCNTELTTEKLAYLCNRFDLKGVLLVESWNSLKNLEKLNIPIIHVNDASYVKKIPGLLLNNEKGGYEIGKHLCALGHKKIGVIEGHPDSPHNKDRMKGFLRALKEAGVKLLPHNIQIGNFLEIGGYECGLKILSQPDRPTAIFCLNDRMAMGLLKVAAEKEISVPRDLSVVGFDDIELAGRLNPPLTTYRNDPLLLGRMAIKYMIEMMEKKVEMKNVILDGTLVVRESTAPPNGSAKML